MAKKFLMADRADMTTMTGLVTALNALGLSKHSFEAVQSEDGATDYGIAVKVSGETLGYIPCYPNKGPKKGTQVLFYGDEDGQFVVAVANDSISSASPNVSYQVSVIFGRFYVHGVGVEYRYYALGKYLSALADTCTAVGNATTGLGPDSSSSSTGIGSVDGCQEANTLGLYPSNAQNGVYALVAWPWVYQGSITCDGVYAATAYDASVGSQGQTVIIGDKVFRRITACLLGLMGTVN